MAIENLECQVRDRETGAKSPLYRVPGDPEDAKELQKLLEELAKGWHNLPDHPTWRPRYEMTVKRLGRPSADEIHVPGLPYEG